ncbi:MAG: Unknown protein [uncultured Sulfurovum sp.]|uniref:SEC-C motif domain protein n=1 Tax=uncultured Sulfurovum sp. TaxID=269237 RepID=A0A6S6TBB2_9BACT|nr:MAG: Unknown protein [uncultured Sulfurovum sp.]
MKNINMNKLDSLTTDDLMRTEELTPNYRKLGFNEANIDDLIEIALDKDMRFSDSDDEKEMYYPCHAIQILGQLGTLKPFDALLKRIDDFVEDDYYTGAVAYYLRKIGSDKKKELITYFLNPYNEEGNRLLILEVLETFMKEKSSFNQELEEALIAYLNREDETYDLLNASVIFDVIDISGAKHIDLIRDVFEKKPVDIFYDGDLEDIEIKLGLREKRSKPREKNFLQKMVEQYELEDKLMPLISNKEKTGRNDPCPCGSGKKYKKCCLNK